MQVTIRVVGVRFEPAGKRRWREIHRQVIRKVRYGATAETMQRVFDLVRSEGYGKMQFSCTESVLTFMFADALLTPGVVKELALFIDSALDVDIYASGRV